MFYEMHSIPTTHYQGKQVWQMIAMHHKPIIMVPLQLTKVNVGNVHL